MMRATTDLECPTCHGSKFLKYGRTRAGLQKYRCMDPDCRRQFVAGSKHMLSPKIKDLVIQKLSAGIHPTVIIKEIGPEVSLRWVYALRRKMRKEISDKCRVLTDQGIDQKIKKIILNMLAIGLKPSVIKKSIGEGISLRYIYMLRKKRAMND